MLLLVVLEKLVQKCPREAKRNLSTSLLLFFETSERRFLVFLSFPSLRRLANISCRHFNLLSVFTQHISVEFLAVDFLTPISIFTSTYDREGHVAR